MTTQEETRICCICKKSMSESKCFSKNKKSEYLKSCKECLANKRINRNKFAEEKDFNNRYENEMFRIKHEREALDRAIDEFLHYARKDCMSLPDIEKEWMTVIKRAKHFYEIKVSKAIENDEETLSNGETWL